tara:strand:- start:999 stop:1259 length:261 start_codon:yes stop_codon:yes gene_type:complete
MTKIQATIKSDSFNKNGRTVKINWTTDDEVINSYLKCPRIYEHQFDSNITPDQVDAAFKAETIPLVKNAEIGVSSSMTGTQFEVET